MQFRVRLLTIGVIFCCWAGTLAAGDPSSGQSTQILDSYLAVSRSQRDRMNGTIAEVSIDAELPKLHKWGRLSALRHISRVGRITYDILRFDGDNAVKNDVIARYLSAEVQVRESSDASVAVIPDNYKFSFKGLRRLDGRDVYVFELKPRAKHKGLFKGTLWMDAHSYQPVREAGYFVKSPSVFIKKVYFTRDYETANGMAVVARIDTTVKTRIVGEAHMTVRYADYRFDPSPVGVGLISAGSQ
jgi:outer membrane lipoprotein-sorting protein